MKRLDCSLTAQQIKKLKTLKKETGLSVSELIRRAIDRYLKEDR